MRVLMWFRADLRVSDNRALAAARDAQDDGIVAVFAICPKQWRHEHDWADVKVDFLLRNLHQLKTKLAEKNIPLRIIERDMFDDVARSLLDLARKSGCDALYFNEEYEVNERRRDAAVQRLFETNDFKVRRFTDQVVLEPDAFRTSGGGFYSVFTPYKRKWLDTAQRLDSEAIEPVATPRKLSAQVTRADELPGRVKYFDAQRKLPDLWPAGEDAAQRRLRTFIEKRVADYHDRRDTPSVDGTSRMSPYLTLGVISPRQCIAAAREANNSRLCNGKQGIDTWISELVWREFYRHVIVGYPRVSKHRPLLRYTDAIDWNDDEDAFSAWCEGRTGVPVVDAGMRQLLRDGWMHNRVRMIVAAFLTKDLFIDWRRGEQHFMRRLIDGDLASNNGGWQWAASTGTDAQPYFRIFNPFTQGKRWDPDGTYIRRYVSELADVDTDALHDPKQLDDQGRAARKYPPLMVNHKAAREHAIAAFKRAKG